MREFSDHDHGGCISDALLALDQHCAQARLKLTSARRRVLEILLFEHRAVGAYKILEILQSEGTAPQPPIVYRALDFLVSQGFAHKVEGLNAFVACAHPGERHAPTFLICRKCETVAETKQEHAQNHGGFRVEHATVEFSGLCGNCQDAST